MTPDIAPGLSWPTMKRYIDKNKGLPTVVPPPIIERIMTVVSDETKVSIEEMISLYRTRRITEARQICMWLIRKKTKLPLVQIGKELKRHHSTVINALFTVDDLIYSNPKFKKLVQSIEEKL